MLFRNLMLFIGAALVIGGAVFSLTYLRQSAPAETETAAPAPAPEVQQPRPAEVLVAAHPLSAGTLLRQGDLEWKEVGAADMRPGFLLHNQIVEAEFYGAIARRDFAGGEAVIASDLLKPSDRQFLSAVLKPGTRAVSIAVDAPQSSSGLVLPGDRVDVILIQNLANAGADTAHKTVAETVLRDVRVIAVDQALFMRSKPVPAALPDQAKQAEQPRLPKTVTLEVSERQAERLFVAAQLGALQLSIRPFEAAAGAAADEQETSPTWAVEVSPALGAISPKPQSPTQAPATAQSSIESSIRRPPAVSLWNEPREVRHD